MKTAQEIETEFLAAIVQKTWKPLDDWMQAIGASGKAGAKEILGWLKEEYGLGHDQAYMLATVYANGGKPKYDDAEGLLRALFAKDRRAAATRSWRGPASGSGISAPDAVSLGSQAPAPPAAAIRP